MALDLELRKSYLGATDLVAISGLSDYRKPGDVWLEKMGQSTFAGNAATEWGTDLEPIVALRHGRKFGVQLLELPPEPVYHPKFPFIAGNVDRIYSNRKRILECKTAAEEQLYRADSSWGEDGETNRVPLGYLGQVTAYIGLLGYEDAYLSAMFLGRSRIQRDYPISFDRDLYDMLIQNGVQFWETYVIPRVQPPVEMFSAGTVMKAVALKALSEEKVLEATPAINLLASRYKELSREITSLEGEKKMAGAQIAKWITEQAGTKVKHSLGSFTFKKGTPKPPEPITDWKAAFHVAAMSLPAEQRESIVTNHTTTPASEPSEPVLRPYWAK